MKKIETIISPFTLDPVKDALAADGIEGMTVSEVKGYDGHADHIEMYRGTAYSIDFHAKLKIELAVNDDQVMSAVSILERAVRTSKVGNDAKIFVFPLEDAVRIRTGEHGVDALRANSHVVRDVPAAPYAQPSLMPSAV